ncbi:MAG TPA: hypothetical protein PLL00_13850 [Bacteroidia bacterium]|nr:hypothetical protein [Bacteroidia bacterium]
MPYWAALVMVTCSIIYAGLEGYEKYLDIQLKRLDLDEKTKEHIARQSSEMENLKSEPLNPVTINIQQNIYRFQTQIYQPNITIVRVNGQEVRNKLDNNKLQ